LFPLKNFSGTFALSFFAATRLFAEKQDDMIESAHSFDAATCLPVFSLYGERRQPSEAIQEFYDSYANSPRNAAGRLRRKWENLDRRIRRMEDQVTGREFEWERKFRREN
jgi:hypothetical protein